MAKFIVYNIQLLPNEDGISEVGKAGYRRLMALLRDANKEAIRTKTVESFHIRPQGGANYGPLDFSFPAGRVQGYFVRYTRIDSVVDLASGKTIFKRRAGHVAAAGAVDIPFLFDTDSHLMAINSTPLPSAHIFKQVLEKFLRPLAEKNFPDHTLKINLVAKQKELEDVFKKAIAYRKVSAIVTFANGPETEELLRELQDSKTQTLVVTASAGRGKMSNLPNFLKDILRVSMDFGRVSISYLAPKEGSKSGDNSWQEFKSEDVPITFSVRHSRDDDQDTGFFDRVEQNLATAKESLDEDDDE